MFVLFLVRRVLRRLLLVSHWPGQGYMVTLASRDTGKVGDRISWLVQVDHELELSLLSL